MKLIEMKVENNKSRDICLTLNNEKFEALTSKKSEKFFDNTIRAFSEEAESYFFLGYCEENSHKIKTYGHKLDGIQLVFPDLEDAYYINLLEKAKSKLKQTGEYSCRYSGKSKLVIKIENELD